MKRFWTGLVVHDGDGFRGARCCGAGWEAEIAPHPKSSKWNDQTIHLLAKTAGAAQRGLELIWTSISIIHTDPIDIYDFPEVVELVGGQIAVGESLYRSAFDNMRADSWSYGVGRIPRACDLAAHCSRAKRKQYALLQLGLSQSVAAIHYQDLNPSHWKHGPAVSKFHRDHVRFAYAIIAAYASLENLGLEIRASQTKPSTVDGKWNPVVKQELEARLREHGIDQSETIPWMIRGSPRRIEKRRPIVILKLTRFDGHLTSPKLRAEVFNEQTQEFEVRTGPAGASVVYGRVQA